MHVGAGLVVHVGAGLVVHASEVVGERTLRPHEGGEGKRHVTVLCVHRKLTDEFYASFVSVGLTNGPGPIPSGHQLPATYVASGSYGRM